MEQLMSLKDARKIAIIEHCLDGRFSNRQAADLLKRSVRQVQRLKKRGRDQGLTSMLHQNRGRKPACAIDQQTKDTVVRLFQEKYSTYNFTHYTDVLEEEESISISRSSVSRTLHAALTQSPKAKRRPKRHRSRDPRPHEGELVEMDASPFDWLSNGTRPHLHGALDDATGQILALHLEAQETHHGYSELIFQMNQAGHLPKEIYVDRRGVFLVNKVKANKLSLEDELAGVHHAQSQFERAMDTLGILMIYANSCQAKGGVERLWETLQDRLVKDLKRHGCTTIEQANQFLKTYIPYFNRKFAVPAKLPDKAYLPHVPLDQLKLVLAFLKPRKLDNGLSFSFNCQLYRLPNEVNGKKILAAPHDIVTVAYSDYLGVRVIFDGSAMKPVLLQRNLKSSIPESKPALNSTDMRSANGRKGALKSPWRGDSTWLFPNRHRGDIFTDQSSP
jgi:transposase